MVEIEMQEFVDVVERYREQDREIVPESRLFYDLELDSFDIIALICLIEETFLISIDLSYEGDVETIEDFYQFVRLHSGQDRK